MGTVLSLSVNNQRSPGFAGNPSFFVDTDDAYTQELIFPFSSLQEYEAQAVKYSLYSLVNYNELNGYTMDTPEALTGNP